MVFRIFDDIIDAVGKVTGSILGVSIAVIAEALSIPVRFVKEAKDAGCETYDEIRDWYQDNMGW